MKLTYKGTQIAILLAILNGFLMTSLYYPFGIFAKELQMEFGWSDLGTWVSLYELLEKDSNNNVHKGDVLIHDAKNNLVISDDQLISIVGLNNVGVINYNGKILVIDLHKSEEVRHIISQLSDKDK